MSVDLFATALQDETALRALYEMPHHLVAHKEIDHLDAHQQAIPDATGSKRLDTFRNVLQTGRAGLEEQPSPAAMLRDHVGDPDFTLEQAEQRMVDSVTVRLA